MDFQFSDEHDELRHTARSLLGRLCSEDRVRTKMEAGVTVDADLWKQIADLGWLSIDLPVDAGGSGAGFVETAILLEEVARAIAPIPFLPTLLAIGALHRAGESALVEELVRGDKIGAAVWANQLGVSAPGADALVAATPDRVSLMDGHAVQPLPGIDLTRSVGWVRAGGRVIGDAEAAEDLLRRGAVATSALLLGGAEKVLEMAVQYAKDRHQFGRPIGSFQAIKHHCANMLIDVEGMRSLVYWAAWCIQEDHPDAAVAASAAKVCCAEAGPRVIATGLQVHGGIGFTWEHPLHFYLKRARLDQVTFGAAPFHRQRLNGLLRARLASSVDLT